MKKPVQEIHDFLQSQGFTVTEITLFVTALQHGTATASVLARQASIKRTTAHSALANLVQKGMMGVHTQSATTYYTAIDPNLIERNLVERIDTLKQQRLELINLLPLFEDMSAGGSSTTEVASYAGMDGVKTAVDTALYCVSRTWKIIAPTNNIFSEGDKKYADYFIRTRVQRGIKAQSLWEPEFIKGRTFGATAFEFRNPRILPKQFSGRFQSTVILFDSSVLFVNSATEQTAVVIRSKEIHQTMEVFFNRLWQNAQLIPKRNIRAEY